MFGAREVIFYRGMPSWSARVLVLTATFIAALSSLRSQISNGDSSDLTTYQGIDVDRRIQESEQNMRNELTMALAQQRLRDHPEEAPAAVAERIATHPDIVARARAAWEASWDAAHPFKTSFDRPQAPDDYLDNAVRMAEASKHPDLDTRVEALEAKIASLERAKAQTRTAGHPSPAPVQAQANAPARPPAPAPVSVLIRTLPDGRVMAIIGGNTIYFKSVDEAKAAADLARRSTSAAQH